MRSEDQVAAMSCPVCRVPLSMSERSGIEIDYCPQCRGVWLDRGELDKIIERSAPAETPPAPPPPPAPGRPQPAPPLHTGPAHDPWGAGGYGHGGYGHGHGKPYKKRKSFLSELFDD